MPKYLVELRYNSEGAKGVMREGGTSRREAAAKLAESLGGRLEAMYFAFGDVDVYAICDLPDEASAVRCSLAVNGSAAGSARVVPLISPETMDAAAKLDHSFRAAGQ
jgi:uncharacterized protein with GYD domain